MQLARSVQHALTCRPICRYTYSPAPMCARTRWLPLSPAHHEWPPLHSQSGASTANCIRGSTSSLRPPVAYPPNRRCMVSNITMLRTFCERRACISPHWPERQAPNRFACKQVKSQQRWQGSQMILAHGRHTYFGRMACLSRPRHCCACWTKQSVTLRQAPDPQMQIHAPSLKANGRADSEMISTMISQILSHL